MSHDEFCPCSDSSWTSKVFCRCDEIRNIRADEAAKHHQPQQCCIRCGIHANPHRGGGCMLR